MDQDMRELFGHPGEAVPQVDPEDVKAVWMLSQEVKQDYPGQSVGIGAEMFERGCKPGANIPAVTYRAGMIRMLKQMDSLLQDKLDAVFRVAAEIPMEWMGVGAPRKGLPFDPDDFVRRVREAA